jgi:DNA-binding response OmpR family regulator
MTENAQILIADDDQTFRESTAELLRQQGFKCDCAVDGTQAAEMLCKNEFDLLISDIKMPGNPKLELVRDIQNISDGLPVILVTGYPVLESAIQSIELPVEAYLVKPIDFEKLLDCVRSALQHGRLYHSVRKIKQRLKNWQDELTPVESLIKQKGRKEYYVSINTYLELTFQHLTETLGDLKHLVQSSVPGAENKQICHLYDCPRLTSLLDILNETIEVLEKSKRAFKSKGLGLIRKKLEDVVHQKNESTEGLVKAKNKVII